MRRNCYNYPPEKIYTLINIHIISPCYLLPISVTVCPAISWVQKTIYRPYITPLLTDDLTIYYTHPITLQTIIVHVVYKMYEHFSVDKPIIIPIDMKPRKQTCCCVTHTCNKVFKMFNLTTCTLLYMYILDKLSYLGAVLPIYGRIADI